MADVVDVSTRSRMMSGIRHKDTAPELLVRRSLHAQGFRFRLHVAGLPGRPDIILPKHRAAILVHGCFWHRHPGCRFATVPATRPEFWAEKFKRNVERDRQSECELRQLGWRVATLWECGVRKFDDEAQARLAEWLRSDLATVEHPLPGKAGGTST